MTEPIGGHGIFLDEARKIVATTIVRSYTYVFDENKKRDRLDAKGRGVVVAGTSGGH